MGGIVNKWESIAGATLFVAIAAAIIGSVGFTTHQHSAEDANRHELQMSIVEHCASVTDQSSCASNLQKAVAQIK
jgi:hypothetical protein